MKTVCMLLCIVGSTDVNVEVEGPASNDRILIVHGLGKEFSGFRAEALITKSGQVRLKLPPEMKRAQFTVAKKTAESKLVEVCTASYTITRKVPVKIVADPTVLEIRLTGPAVTINEASIEFVYDGYKYSGKTNSQGVARFKLKTKTPHYTYALAPPQSPTVNAKGTHAVFRPVSATKKQMLLLDLKHQNSRGGAKSLLRRVPFSGSIIRIHLPDRTTIKDSFGRRRASLEGATIDSIVFRPGAMTIDQIVKAVEYQRQTRTRVITRQIPTQEQRTRTVTVMRPVQKTREEQYTVSVPVQQAREETYSVMVPVQVERNGMRTVRRTVVEPKEQTYTVMVPVQVARQATRTVTKTVYDTQEQKYTVNVPVQEERTGMRTVAKTVYDTQEQKYTVNVPVQEERTGMRTVCKTVMDTQVQTYEVSVPYQAAVTGTRLVPAVVPVVRMQTIIRDLGYWAFRGGRCAWVANPTSVQVPSVTQERRLIRMPYAKTVTKYKPETKTRTVQVARQVQEQVPYTYTVTVMQPETKTRTVNLTRQVQEQVPYTYTVTVMKPETKTRTVNFATYQTETRTRTVNYTEMIAEQQRQVYSVTIYKTVTKEEPYEVSVPVVIEKRVSVGVTECRPVTVRKPVTAVLIDE